MGLPAKRRTKQSKRERASHFALKGPGVVRCSHCRKFILPHRVCPHCGYYRGRDVLRLETKLAKAERKNKAKGKQEEQNAER